MVAELGTGLKRAARRFPRSSGEPQRVISLSGSGSVLMREGFMHPERRSDEWADGAAYEAFMGPWSRAAAEQFLPWLGLPTGLRWLDVGCGTGALSESILRHTSPEEVRGIDQSAGYVAHARAHVSDERARFDVGEATALPVEPASFDAAVSGLVLNFVPDPVATLRGMARAVRPGGEVAVYVWDYAGGMEFLRRFWDAAVSLDPEARELDEGRRFPICHPDALGRAFEAADLENIEVSALDVPTVFESFDAYWSPFLGGQGPAPGYARGLSEAKRAELRDRLRSELGPGTSGHIHLSARAWAARGIARTDGGGRADAGPQGDDR